MGTVLRYDGFEEFISKFQVATEYRIGQGVEVSHLIDEVFKMSRSKLNVRHGQYVREYDGKVRRVKYIGMSKNGKDIIYFEAELGNEVKYEYARIIRRHNNEITDAILGNENEEDRVVTKSRLDRLPNNVKKRVTKSCGVDVK